MDNYNSRNGVSGSYGANDLVVHLFKYAINNKIAVVKLFNNKIK